MSFLLKAERPNFCTHRGMDWGRLDQPPEAVNLVAYRVLTRFPRLSSIQIANWFVEKPLWRLKTNVTSAPDAEAKFCAARFAQERIKQSTVKK